MIHIIFFNCYVWVSLHALQLISQATCYLPQVQVPGDHSVHQDKTWTNGWLQLSYTYTDRITILKGAVKRTYDIATRNAEEARVRAEASWRHLSRVSLQVNFTFP